MLSVKPSDRSDTLEGISLLLSYSPSHALPLEVLLNIPLVLCAFLR